MLDTLKKKHSILYLAANPAELTMRHLDEEARQIQQELRLVRDRARFEFVTHLAVRPMDLLRALREVKPTIVHFSAHAGAGGIHLVDDAFHLAPVIRGALHQTFRATGQSVQIVVLNRCATEDLAKTLCETVPVCVGTAASTDDAAAHAFSIGFYGGLASGEPVGRACLHGSVAMRLAVTSDQRPVLYHRADVDPNTLVLVGESTNDGGPGPMDRSVADPRSSALCEIVAAFALSPSPLPSCDDARSWIEHAATCDQCAERLKATPEAALALIQQARGEADDTPEHEIALSHDTFLGLGRAVCAGLAPAVRERLSHPANLEPMRHEVRYAADLARASPAEIRVAVAISEICLAFEGLVFQDSDEGVAHKIHVRFDGEQLSAGEHPVPREYIPARIADAISCSTSDAAAVFRQALALLRDSAVSLPDFDPLVRGDQVVLIHASDPDRVKIVSVTDDADIDAEYVFMIRDPRAPEVFAAAARRFQIAGWTMRSAEFGAVFWRPS